MSYEPKKQYLRSLQERYGAAEKKDKKLILDEFLSVCKFNRKYAFGLISEEIKSARRLSKKLFPESLLFFGG